MLSGDKGGGKKFYFGRRRILQLVRKADRVEGGLGGCRGRVGQKFSLNFAWLQIVGVRINFGTFVVTYHGGMKCA